MGRSPCCAKEGLNRGAWTAMEDKTLTDYIKLHGEGRWRNLPKRAGLKRCGKSCRLRWLNYLRPDIKRGNITNDEEELIIRLHRLLGNRWSLIAGRLPGRTDNEIKNYWNTNLSRKVHESNCNNKNKSDKNRAKRKSSTINPNPQPAKPDSSRVIRTKAVKCSRIFINPPPAPPPPPPQPLLSTTQIQDPAGHAIGSHNNSDLGLAEGAPMESAPLEFPGMDFNVIGELNLSEFLDSHQLSEFCCEFSHETSNEGDENSPSSSLEDPIVFPEEMMEDWRRTASALDASMVEYWF